ncbi:MAG: tail fiber domain-containing protein [Anaerolineales bacterium]
MKKKQLFLSMIILLVITTLSCNVPGLFARQSEPDIERAVEMTLAASSDASSQGEDAPAEESQATQAAPTDAPPTDTPLPSDTPTVTATFTPSVPMVSVNQNTNCRTGPGTVYDLLGALLIGENAEVVARSSQPNYVIIDNPDKPGTDCWLWMQYGQIEGSTDGLPILDPPPTPTPEPSPTPELNFSLSLEDIGMCGPKENIFVRITNTGAITIESLQFSATDQDTSEVVAYSSNNFAGSPTCIALIAASISPGNHAFSGAGFSAPIGGHTISVTVKACASDGYGEPCRTKSVNLDIPAPSNVNLKENFENVDSQQILEQVADLPITAWNYRDPDRPGRHIGPMAQDFYDLFGVGQSQEYINAVDSYGVSLSAIQALYEISEEQSAEIEALRSQNDALAQQNAQLAARVDAMAGRNSRFERISYVTLGFLTLIGLSAGYSLLMRSKETENPD